MIASLTGLVTAREQASCVLDVNGVGYLLQASTPTLAGLPSPPTRVTLLTEMQVREDAITLFGFADPAERDWFRLLTGVQGVGGRVALALLSTLPPASLAAAIATQDKSALGRAPGVGPKLAARLATELKDRAGTVSIAHLTTLPPRQGTEADALSALINLGYRRAEAEAALARATTRLGDAATLDALIRDGLKELAR